MALATKMGEAAQRCTQASQMDAENLLQTSTDHEIAEEHICFALLPIKSGSCSMADLQN